MRDYDLVIIGGGLVGGSLACALSGQGLRIAVVEAVAATAERQPSYDERVIALSWGSRVIFESIGLWSAIAPEAEPILQVHVSDLGHFGLARIDLEDAGVAALGYVTPARVMGMAIRAALAAAPDVDLLCPARIIGHRVAGERVELEIMREGECLRPRTALLVAADGGDSPVRQQLGCEIHEVSYGQDAIITTVTPRHPRVGVAYERFTDTGPLALLPMTEGRYSVVWTCRSEQAPELLMRSDEAFLERLQARFGYRLGHFQQVAPRQAYPLRLVLTRNPVRSRVVLIGNAAHTLHPVAGQGFNLGLRDVAALAESVVQAVRAGADPGGPAALADYRAWRGTDQERTARLTDLLARGFANPWPPLALARDLALLGLDLLPPARRRLARRFMGIDGRLPRLARGLTLERVDVTSSPSG
ncbi:MAG: 2-octaprenyl-6-methoxyphenyl hydroxylase [Sphingobacteriia bacterium]|nr:2-octaprenyl-6-methoxyphenyl hydroxylase [Sphingobacteriia bacterium]NCC39249.1 2-octaprenyl-6-methoxyphenyl hydroxylase [Gammaproteobacteria bacterium]